MDRIVKLFDTPVQNLRWADEALREFVETRNEYHRADPYEVNLDSTSDPFMNIICGVVTAPPPDRLARLATEALNNIRHSFDQLMYAACNAIGKPPEKSIYFPWASHPNDLEVQLAKRKIPREFWDIIRDHQPYPTGPGYVGGQDILRKLAHIAINKHTIGIGITPSASASPGNIKIDKPGTIIAFTSTRQQVNQPFAIFAANKHIDLADAQVAFRTKIVFDEDPPLLDLDVFVHLWDFLYKSNNLLDLLIRRCADFRKA